MDIIGPEEIADAAVTVVGGPMPDGMLVRRPGGPSMRVEGHRPQFVEANYDRVLRRPLVEAVDSFFLAAKSGSVDFFRVRVR